MDPVERERAIRRALLVLAALVAGAAAVPEFLATGPVHIGPDQLLLLGLAVATAVFAWLGPRRGAAYRGTALVLLNTIVMLMVLEVVASGALRLLGTRPEPVANEFGTAKSNPFFADKEWAAAFWAEANEWHGSQAFAPYVMWRARPFAGRFFTIVADGSRPGEVRPCKATDAHVVLLGSSALWGWGLPDSFTIAHYLDEEFAARGINACVVNRAQNGYVSTQDVIELLRMVETGEQVDHAIFFDGFNDPAAAVETGMPGVHYQVDRVRSLLEGGGRAPEKRFTPAIIRLIRRSIPSRPAIPPDLPGIGVASLPAEVVRAYLANVRAASGLADEAGFRVSFLWQPYARWGRTPAERARFPGGGSFAGREPVIDAVYAMMHDSAAAMPNVAFVADSAVASAPEDWLDIVHLAPSLNRRMARIIARVVADSR